MTTNDARPDRISLEPSATAKPRVMFCYWGRRGAMSRFTLEVARASSGSERVEGFVCVSRQNEIFSTFEADEKNGLTRGLLPIDTFDTNLGAALHIRRVFDLRKKLAAHIVRDRIDAVIELMPHIWTPLIAPVYGRAGARFVSVVHDADAHPGDPTGAVHNWSQRGLRYADNVVTLSETVAERLAAKGSVPQDKLRTLFLPDLTYGAPASPQALIPGEPVRLLFLGRILPYKGLSLLVDTLELLRLRGVPVHVGVFGEGELGRDADRLTALGAEVVNRWLTEEEIATVTARYHAVILSHIEASQSGVAATALGSGIPVVTTPVGGLPGQIDDGRTGIVAERADPEALADCIERLVREPGLYDSMCAHIAATRDTRSMRRFVADICRIAVPDESAI